MRVLPTAIVALALVGGGCGSGEEGPEPGGTADRSDRPATKREGRGAGERTRTAEALEPVRCTAEVANCASASGRIIYVERIDPDGDGDAHFVLSGGDVTGSGISVIDVAAELRPKPLPAAGDLLSAAGPVFQGSYGQRQIEAVEISVAYRD